jgi:hypothetical protein
MRGFISQGEAFNMDTSSEVNLVDTSSEVSQCQLFSSTISPDMILEYLHQRVMIFSSERIVIYLDPGRK